MWVGGDFPMVGALPPAQVGIRPPQQTKGIWMEKREATMSSWSPEGNQSPGVLDAHLSRTLFLLLLIVAPSVHGVTPNPEACQVFQSSNGSSINCYPPAKFPRQLPADTIFLSVEFFNLTQLPPETLQGIPNLQELHLSSNRLEKLSAKFLLPVPQLKVLDLTRNALTRLPPGLFQGSATLHTLVLNQNQLEVLETSWLQGLKALRHLDLSGNQLRTLPSGLLANFTDLRILDLGNNQLESLPSDLLRGPLKLERLHLEGNRLQALEEGLLEPQPNLSYLFLSDNRLATVAASAFQGLKQLGMLDLSNNSLSSVPKGLWASVGQPGAGRDMKDGFDISGNPWNCDQNLDDFYEWLVCNKDKMFFQNNTYCVEPKAMHGQTLLAVAMSHLKLKAGVEMDRNGLAEHCTPLGN